MKKIEKFGAWIISEWDKGLMLIACLATLVWIIAIPKHVSLSEKEFKCIESEPYGLETRCVTYTRKVR